MARSSLGLDLMTELQGHPEQVLSDSAAARERAPRLTMVRVGTAPIGGSIDRHHRRTQSGRWNSMGVGIRYFETAPPNAPGWQSRGSELSYSRKGREPVPNRNSQVVAFRGRGMLTLTREHPDPIREGLLHLSPASAGRLIAPLTVGR